MASAIILYGIPNCDTVKKARNWLDGQGILFAFHDYKKAGVDRDKLVGWCNAVGWEVVLNRAGTTFKKLNDNDKTDMNQEKAVSLMVAQPSMIKRPIVELPNGVLTGGVLVGGVLVGFKIPEWEAAFA